MHYLFKTLLFVWPGLLATVAIGETSYLRGWSSAGAGVAYLTDLEGNRAKFENWLSESGAFLRGPDGKYRLRDGFTFVYGGDAPDRFEGSQWVVENLVRLKAEAISKGQGDSVIILSGNRDMNKVRLLTELSEASMKEGVLPQYREKWENFMNKVVVAAGVQTDESAVTSTDRKALDTRSERLRFLLAETMASPQAFELRRKELSERERDAKISDTQVVESYLREVRRGGDFRKLMEQSQLAYRKGNTLYVHSSVTSENFLYVPNKKEKSKDVDTWIREVNEWYQSEIKEWTEKAGKWNGRGRPPGETLVEYSAALPGENTNPFSLNYSRNADSQGKISLPPQELIDALRAQGIERVVIGHTPSGQIPVVLRSQDGRFELINGDNSYSPDKNLASQIFLPEGGKSVRIKGSLTLKDGQKTSIRFSSVLGLDPVLGRRLLTDGVVVSEKGNGEYVVYELKPGFKVEYTVVSKEEALQKMPGSQLSNRGCNPNIFSKLRG